MRLIAKHPKIENWFYLTERNEILGWVAFDPGWSWKNTLKLDDYEKFEMSAPDFNSKALQQKTNTYYMIPLSECTLSYRKK